MRYAPAALATRTSHEPENLCVQSEHTDARAAAISGPMLHSTRRARPSSGRLPAFFFRVRAPRTPTTDATVEYPAAKRTMPGNSAPAAYQQQGEVLNAFARDQNAPNADFAALLDEDYLRALKPAKKDAKLPANAEPKNFRYHARRHMAAALGWRDRQPFPNAVDEALYARRPSATRTGYVPPDEDAEDPGQQETP